MLCVFSWSTLYWIIVFLYIFSSFNFCYYFILQALEVSSYDLIHNTTFLYPFMQFMKGENAINILQFCLTVGKFCYFKRFSLFPVKSSILRISNFRTQNSVFQSSKAIRLNIIQFFSILYQSKDNIIYQVFSRQINFWLNMLVKIAITVIGIKFLLFKSKAIKITFFLFGQYIETFWPCESAKIDFTA